MLMCAAQVVPINVCSIVCVLACVVEGCGWSH